MTGYKKNLVSAALAACMVFSLLQGCKGKQEEVRETGEPIDIVGIDHEVETLEETEESTEETTEEETTEAPEPKEITIAAIGDMLMHPGVSGLAFQADGSINYDFIFDAIREDISSADIAVVNNEVPFGGDEYGLQNYPCFNVYSQLGDAEVSAGFDVILNATNHVMDQNVSGLQNTINFWKKYPQETILGVHETQEDQNSLKIVEVDGVRIAMFNYVYDLNSYGLPADRPYMVDLMQDAYKDKIANELMRAEEEADFTIVFPHWGEEYHLRETADQDAWAAFFTQYGADLIIGTHPHVLEPVKTVVSENGNTSLCYYSLGNYISMQDETFGVLGGMAKVTLLADETGVHIKDNGMQYLFTYYDPDVSYAYVKKLEDVTQDLIDTHGILVKNLPGNGFNKYYPFAISTFYEIIEEVNGTREVRVDPGTAQGEYYAAIQAEKERQAKEAEEAARAAEEASRAAEEAARAASESAAAEQQGDGQ